MNAGLKTLLSMSVSGGLLILVLLLGKRFYRDRLSRQWQYYIWLAVVLRLVVPLGPETSLMGVVCQTAEQAVSRPVPVLSQGQLPPDVPEDDPAAGAERRLETAAGAADDLTAAGPLQKAGAALVSRAWLIWLMVSAGLLIRKITIYQSFVRYLKAGWTPVSNLALLDRLSGAAARAGVKTPVELCLNPLVSSPLAIGFFRPCIVLPGADIPEQDFLYIVMHELTHIRRRDLFYKWLVQVTVCLHWFNPLVYLMSREVSNACECSCDEAVLAKMGRGHARDYGKTLLDAAAAAGGYREAPGAVTLNEQKQLLKERINAIMNVKKRSMATHLLTGMLTLCIVFSAAFVGIYPTSAAADVPNLTHADNSSEMETLDFKGTTYYLVYNEAQLRAIGTGKYGLNLNYMQQADISLSAGDWVPIGTWDAPFTGTYNGNGFEIKDLTMTDPDAEIIGLFGVAKNAHIYNITLRDYDITSAGKNAANKSVGAVLAIGQGSRSYDNAVYPKEAAVSMEDHSSEIDRYYKAGSLPLFEITFSRLNEADQRTWLEKLYAENDFAFFSAAVRGLDENSSLLTDFAEKAYADEEMAFFSTLTDRMDEAELERWLDRALEDGNWAFQSVLSDKLDRSGEFNGLKEKQQKDWAEAQAAEYRAVGVTAEDGDYYWQGQLVGVFLDLRSNQSFYTLNMNPKGTVHVKIIRDADGKITGAACMTEAELAELLGDLDDPDNNTGVEIIPVDLRTVAAGEAVFLGEYTLSGGDEILYDISAKTGNRMKVFFAKDGQKDTAYWSVNNRRQPGEPLECIADFAVEPPAAGTYRLYLQAPDGALGTVRGSVSLTAG